MKLLKITLTILFAAFIGYVAEAQIKVGDNPLTIDDGSILELESINKAFVLPRMTTSQRDQIPSPLKSAMVFNTSENCIQINVGTPAAPEWHCLTYSEIDEDNQIITEFSFDSLTNKITLIIENGDGPKTIDLKSLDKDEQQLSLNGNVLTLENGGQVNLEPYLDNKDQIITAFYLNSDPTSPDFNHIVYRLAGDSINQEHKIDLNFLDVTNTDKQNLTSATITNNILTIDIERGDSVTVDLSQYVNDDQEIEEFQIIGDVLYLTIEDGGGQVEVDLSPYLDDTDNQKVDLFEIVNDKINLSLERDDVDPLEIDLEPYLDNQHITATIQENGDEKNLFISIEDGNSQTVDLSIFDNAGTDNQNLTNAVIDGNNLLTIYIENGDSVTVDLSQYMDDTDTDDQQITRFELEGTDLKLKLDENTEFTVPLSILNDAGSDNQNLTSAVIDGNNLLTIDIENGDSVTVDLSEFVDTDKQDLENAYLDGNILHIEIQNGEDVSVDLQQFMDHVNTNTDEQDLENAYLDGNILHIEIQNGEDVSVDLQQFMDHVNTNTDEQDLENAYLDGNILHIEIQNGEDVSVDLQQFMDHVNTNTDEQDLENAYLDGNILHIEIQNGEDVSVDLQQFMDHVNTNTDEQKLDRGEIIGNTLFIGIEGDNPNTDLEIPLDQFINTDAQEVTTFSIVDSTLVLDIQNGGGEKTIPLGTLLSNAGSDDQNLETATLSGDILTITIEDGSSVEVNLEQFMDDTDTDMQELTYTLDNNILALTIDNGNTVTIDLNGFDNAGTDNQKIDELTFDGTTLGISLEDDEEAIKTINLSDVNTDEQGVDLFTIQDSTLIISLDNNDSNAQINLNNIIKNAGSDDQNLTSATLDGNDLTISIENGNPVTVDLTQFMDDEDTQDITEFTLNPDTKMITLSIQDGGTETINLSEFINTDTQDIETFSIDPDTKVITLTIQDGGTETINLSEFINTDEQTLSFDDTNNKLSISNGNDVFLDSLDTDRQKITLFELDANDNLVLSIERGGSKTINLAEFDNFGTDNQNLDRGELIDDILYIGIEGDDAETDLAIDISGIDTDEQGVDVFTFVDSTLTISLERNDTEAFIDLADVFRNAGSDNQNLTSATLDGNDLTITIENGNPVTVDLTQFMDDTDTDTQDIETFSYNETTKEITIEITDGGGEKVISLSDLISSDDQKVDEFSFDGSSLTLSLEDDNEDAKVIDLTSVNTDNQNLTSAIIDANNMLTIDIESGDSVTVDLSDYFNTDEQTLSFDDTNNKLSISNGNDVFLDSLDTDRQQITLFELDANDNLVLSIERGGSKTINLAEFDNFGTDNQNLDRGELIDDILYIGIEGDDAETDLAIDISGIDTDEQGVDVFTFVDSTLTISLERNDTEAFIDLADVFRNAGSDNQNLTSATLDGNDLTITIENGNPVTVDLTQFMDDTDTDTQDIETFSYNETTKEITIEITDGGGEKVISLSDLISSDDQKVDEFSFDGSSLTLSLEDDNEDAKVIDLTSVNTDNQNLTSAIIDANNMLTIDIESGDSVTVDLSDYFNTDEQTLSFDDTNNKLSISNGNDVFLDSLDTDRQKITLFELDANDNLVLSIERGGSKTINLAEFDNFGTDNQNLDRGELIDDILYIGIEGDDAETDLAIDISGIDTDEQGVDVFTFVDSTLTISLERNDTEAFIDLADVFRNAGSDNQNLTSATLDGNDLTITIENGNPVTVDLTQFMDDTDTDTQDIETFSYNETTKEITIEITDGGGEKVISLSDLISSDDQKVDEFSFDGSSLTLSLEDDNEDAKVIDLTSVNTDNQNLTSAIIDANNVLTIDIESGDSVTVDLSDYFNTDEQTLSFDDTNNKLSISNGNDVFLDSLDTDRQQITLFELDANDNLVLSIERGGSKTINLAEFDNFGTDNQNLDRGELIDDILYIGIEGDDAETDLAIDISGIDTDEQGVDVFTFVDSTLTISLEHNDTEAFIDLADVFRNAGSDNQNLTSATLDGNDLTITIENGNPVTVDLTQFMDDTDTDTQDIETFSYNETTKEITIEITDGGGEKVISLSDLISSDDQKVDEFSFDGSSLTLSLEDDNEDAKVIDLTSVNTDNQNLTSAIIDANNVLTIDIESGDSVTVDLSDYFNTDEQTLSFDDTNNKLSISNGNDVFLDSLDTDRQQITLFELDANDNLVLSIERGGSKTINLAEFDNFGTDNQNLDRGELIDDILYIGIEGDDAETDLAIDISGIDTDEQTIDEFAFDGTTLSLSIENDGEDAKTLDLSVIDTDEQSLDRGELIDSILYIGIEGDDPDNDLEINIAGIDTDEQTLSFDDITNELSISNGNTVDLDSLDTDRQQITLFELDANDNLVLSIERGGSKTINLAEFDNFGTDDQNLEGGDIDNDILTIGIEGDESGQDLLIDLSDYKDNTDEQGVETFTLVDSILTLKLENNPNDVTINLSDIISGSDKQNLSLDTNTHDLSIERGNTVNLAPYADQALTVSYDTETHDLEINLEDGGSYTVNLGDLGEYENIYTHDGTLEANRTVSMDGKTLTFAGSDDVVIHPDGKMSIGKTSVNPAVELEVDGDILAVQVHASSDKRYKKEVETIESALSKVERLRGVSYAFDKAAYPHKNFPAGKQLGFIAQEIEKVLPEVVMTDNDGYKAVDYSKVTAVLAEAVKQQQKQIAELQAQLLQSSKDNVYMKKEMASIKELILKSLQTKESTKTNSEEE